MANENLGESLYISWNKNNDYYVFKQCTSTYSAFFFALRALLFCFLISFLNLFLNCPCFVLDGGSPWLAIWI